MYLAKFLKTPFFTEHLRWLFLYTEVIIYLLLHNLHNLHDFNFNLIYDGPISGLLTDGERGWGGGQAPHSKICHIFSYNDNTWHSYNLPEENQNNI